MRALMQRVSKGAVTIRGQNIRNEIGKGLVILLGVREGDTFEDLVFVADKCCNLRIFSDENDKMNLALKDVNGEVLIISQFTLYGDTRKGNRPSFTDSAKPEIAEDFYNKFMQRVKENIGEEKVKSGEFGAMMDVEIFNDGPVTILVESKA
ncbi:MAG: D-tyrosyl-tRNA(Tyr) deacylase [Ignavibacteriales bacterium]|nr:D-tyrosyl-tRNA(Tyr) deacylase [Ignavibacteriales bacterium]